MTVNDLKNKNIFTLVTEGDLDAEISKVFCCDLLSIAMSKAPAHGAWVTVMGNRNTLAVASLTDTACVILAEDIKFSDADLETAKEQNITIFTSESPIFDSALKIQELL
jgi:hypothetical protein